MYKQYLAVLAFSILFSLAISIIVPFPYSIGVVVGFWMIIPFIVRSKTFRDLFKINPLFDQTQPAIKRYICLFCGNKHTSGVCWKCGSKMKKPEFGT